MKYEVKLRADYVGRVLYVLEIQGQYVMVYKSSGLSGTGHGGEFLPFMYLNGTARMNCMKGYIFKEMFYDGIFVEHRKKIYKYPEVHAFMKQLQEELTHECIDDPDETIEDIYDVCDKFNEEAHAMINENFYDLKNL